MRKMKTLVMILAAAMFAGKSIAQTIEDGKKFLYYERFKSAKDVFQKLSTANPADETAAYYLGQAMIGLEDIAGAKALYQQKLSATPNSPLVLAGMGHVELLEGKLADARSRFETAVNLSASKRIDVLNAVGAPNSDPEARNGDANYAVEKLKLATTLKGFKDPEVWANLGDAYRKIQDRGGDAIQSYDAAIALNANYARAYFRKGRLFQTQGISQEPLYLSLFNDAITKDPNYVPVYKTLYRYYFYTDVTKAASYLEKALAVSDDDPNACYERGNIKFAQGLFAEAITKCNECIAAGGTSPNPYLYGLRAYAYLKTNDSVNAKINFEEYLKRQLPSKIGSGDYSGYAYTLLKFPGSEQAAGAITEKAVALDTLEKNKVDYLKVMAVYYKDKGNFAEAGNWYNRVLAVKKNYNNVDLYNAGYSYYRINKYDSASAVFTKYTTKYPDDMFGFYMLAKSNAGIDSTSTTGLAAASYLKAIEVGERAVDKAKVKDQLSGAYTFMMSYSFNVKRDQVAAIDYANKALALDPADAQAVKNLDFVTKNNPAAVRPAARPAAATKPGTTKLVTTGAKPATAAPKTTTKPPAPKAK
jgi:tetratricopeptide (TPR) repeat protein